MGRVTAFVPDFLTHPDAQALCSEVDSELFFPEKGGTANPAKAICRRCELRDPCLAWALTNGEGGVWGATSEFERRRLRAGRGAR